MSDSPPARASPSPSSPSSSSLHKLPKFLHRHHSSRDRSRSFNEGPYSSSAESSDSAAPPTSHRTLTRRSSRLFGVRERDEPRSNAQSASNEGTDDSQRKQGDADGPLVVEHATSPLREGGALIPRARTRSERPLSVSTLDISRLQVTGSPSAARITDIPGRLSGWFQHAFSSTTDLSLPPNPLQSSSSAASIHSLSQSLPPSSPSSRSQRLRASSPATSIMSHIPGKANFERAVRYLLDSDVAQPDKSTDPIWLLGIEHPGFDPVTTVARNLNNVHRRDSTDSGSTSSIRNSLVTTARPYSHLQHTNASVQSLQTVPAGSPSKSQGRENPWPASFYEDFTSQIWLTYRSHFVPLRDRSLESLGPPLALEYDPKALHELLPNLTDMASSMSDASPPKPRWGWGGEKTWTSDTGWGCMLRTGQSLLATALIHLHLSREWRRPAHPALTTEYATYVKILSWFLDTPSPFAPFGVHRMALAGKISGTDVGCWFGPSVAAGALKKLVHAFPASGLSVSIASDGVLYESDIYSASNLTSGHGQDSSTSPSMASGLSKRSRNVRRKWGGNAVLVLVGIRLGIDGVNPVYYESVKKLFTFPQSVGIAGGRPSSSYYFLGYQADHLFYLDPHHTRPAVALQPLVNPSDAPPVTTTPKAGIRQPSTTEESKTPTNGWNVSRDDVPAKSEVLNNNKPAIPNQTSNTQSSPSTSFSSATLALDPVSYHYATAYTPSDLRTFHCDRVRKMPISSLDPSMLLGFLCRNEADWKDLRSRIVELGRSRVIFSVQDEPPSWGDADDDDVGMESFSEPDSELVSSLEDDTSPSDVQSILDPDPPRSQSHQSHTPFPSKASIDDGEESWINPSPPKPSFPDGDSPGRRFSSNVKSSQGSPPGSSHLNRQYRFPSTTSDDDTSKTEVPTHSSREPSRASRYVVSSG